MKKKSLLIISNNNLGPVQSGGDTIYLNFIKYWSTHLDITLWGSAEARHLLKLNQIKTKFIQTDSINPHYQATIINLFWHHLRRLIMGIIAFIRDLKIFKTSDYCYTASDFWPDFLFGLLYKLVNPQGRWLCGYYLIVPKATSPDSPYQKQLLKNNLYYFSQKLSLKLANKYANFILITSQPDQKYFPKKKTVIVRGGVDLSHSQKIKKIPINRRQFTAVFQGRLHPQKGILSMIDIWKLVVSKIPSAKLAIIGDGQLKDQMLNKIKKLKLQKNISYFGFQHATKKYKIFANSKIVLHPAVFDSGGMSAAEAMAFALPGVSYDLLALKTYYPQGMIKTPLHNQKQFAKNIIRLLEDPILYQKYSRQALSLIKNKWDWQKHANFLYKKIFS